MATNVRVVLVTVPDRRDRDVPLGANLARTLVGERLAACVNRIPGVHSTFLWEGDIQEDREEILVIKTSAGRVAELTERIADLHPYEVPEVLVFEVDEGLPAYLDWVAAGCRSA
ncbi:MAG: Divalent-cation tolerance protein CutA [Calditrichaeota bacterium]|nr:Divalent-cation tolerance protein CutA [Calditrichota bacterium]